MTFSFSATARCGKCGEYLSSSEEECDHDGAEVQQQMFRHIASDTDEVVAVEATIGYKWHALKRERGEDWIAYEWLGPRESVQNMVGTVTWDGIEDLPQRAMSLDAPAEVAEEEPEDL